MQIGGPSWEPGPLATYIGQWCTYWWSLRPMPPKKEEPKPVQKAIALVPISEEPFQFNSKTKSWEKIEKGR